ncbi:MAG: YggS family pyridoxal phosphate enzyme [Actinobacteria bacterium]|nr:MAG: YggS family pyridoxal phosphate enzyme [Actinomycetota bacterium]
MAAGDPRSEHGSLANRAGRVALSPDEVRERYERIRTEIGDAVTIVAATKYVSVEELAVLAEAGIEVVGENRAQDLEAKHARYGDAFRWHFIGHLQSRKAKTINGICELVHSLSSESAAKRLEIPALVEVNLSGEETKAGVSEDDLEALIAAYPDVRGLMTMPPETADPESSRPYFRRLRQLATERGLTELSMGTSQDYRIAVEEGATLIRIGSVLYRG